MSFENVTFKGATSFVDVRFKEFVIFRHATFMYNATTFNTIFPFDTANNANVTFLDSFIIALDDEYSSLGYPLMLPGPGVTFKDARFKNGVTFYKTEFQGITDFREVKVQVTNPKDIPSY